jgi:hypothetical protein
VKKSVKIWVSTEDLVTGNSFIEYWEHYPPNFTEEHAILEVWQVIDRWNATLRKGDNPRRANSFVLETVEVHNDVGLYDLG